jgi:hypothetical protein
MGVIDELKSEKNISLIIYATEKMLKDKYSNINIEKNELLFVVNNIINNICADALLTKNVFVLMELNKITLSKIKDYYDNIINNIDNEKSMKNTISPENENDDNSDIMKYDSDQLLMKVLELEEKRNNIALLKKNIISNPNSTINNPNSTINNPNSTINNTNSTINNTNSTISNISDNNNNVNIIQQQNNINLKLLELLNINTNKNKNKNLIINSYNRDWISNPDRNKISFNINIDLSIHNIKINKILLPVNIKNITPYINLIINDGKINQKIIYILSNNNHNNNNWDIWEPINNDYVLLINKNWHINFTDFLNKELEMGRDSIDVVEVIENDDKDYEEYKYDIIINKKNELVYNSFGINLLRPYDNILIKTNTGDNIIAKIANINDNTISIYSKNIEKISLINSTLLNYKSQYSIIMTYYHKL